MCLLVGLAADLLQIGQEVIHQRCFAVRLRRRAKAALHLIKMRQFTAQLDKCLARSIGLAAILQRASNSSWDSNAIPRILLTFSCMG